jgi:hypothetical protein
MGTIMDYLFWRGDLSFLVDPLNDIDVLILSLISYLPLKDIVPDIESRQQISLKETSDQYFSRSQNKQAASSNIKPTASPSFDSGLLALLREAANSVRFKDVKLSNYVEEMDFVVGQQFGAVTFTLPGKEFETVIAFRGTNNSLIGWKEDFELAYMEQIPAQESAARYLNKTINIFSGKVIVCGHSKGGNLAVYAGSHINKSLRNKLSKIVNFDGPGFDFSIIPQGLFSHYENQVVNYIPEESVVGMLLEPVGKRVVLSSLARGLNQHNALNWKVKQSKFVSGTLSKTTQLLEHTLRTWLADLPVGKREIFIEALFDILGASEGKTIDPKENLKDARTILLKYSKLDSESRRLLNEVILSFYAKSRNTLSATIIENLPRIV